MSMGSDFTGGYNVGLNTSRSGNNPNPWPYLTQNAKNVNDLRIAMASRGGVGKGISAKKILEDSRLEYLRRKEQELNNKALQVDIAAKEQAMRQSKMQELDRRTKDAEDRAMGLRTSNIAEAEKNKTTKETEAKNRAIEGAYTRNPNAIMEYINRNGNKDANAVAVDFLDPDGKDTGKIYVTYKHGKFEDTVAYENAAKFAQQVILPMEVMKKDIEGRITEEQEGKLGLGKEELSVKREELKTKGLPTSKQDSDLKAKAHSEALKEFNAGIISEDDIDTRTEGLYTQWTNGGQSTGNDRESSLKKDLMNNGYNEIEADDYIKRAKEAGKL